MAIITSTKKAFALSIRGSVGKPAGVGHFTLGWSELGDDNLYQACYQNKHTRRGICTSQYAKIWPKNPQTQKQQAHRSIFADGIAAWQALDSGQKAIYNTSKYPRAQSGFHRFMKEYLNEHKT